MSRAAASPSGRRFRELMLAVVTLAAVVGLLLVLPAGGADDAIVVNVVSPTDGQTVSGSVRWEATVEGREARSVDFAIDGVVRWTEKNAPYVFNGSAPTQEGTLDTTTLSEGWHSLTATAYVSKDPNGHSAAVEEEEATIKVLVANAAPPQTLEVSIHTPSADQTVAGAVKWQVSVEGQDLEKVDFAIDGVVRWTEKSAPYVFNGDAGTLDTTALSEGTHELGATAYASSGLKAGDSLSIRVANAARNFTTNVSEGMTVKTPFEWKFTPGEPSVNGSFWADGKLLTTVSGPGPYVWTLAAGALPEGTHKLGHSWDTPDGQRKMASVYSVTVDNPSVAPPPPPPTSSFTTNVSEGMTVKTPFEWKFTPGEPSVNGSFWADGKLLTTVSGPGPYVWTLAAGALPEGTHKLGHSWDTPDGQRKMASVYSVTVDNPSVAPPPPTSSFTTNVSEGMTVKTPFEWKFTPGDPSVKGYFWADGKLLTTVSGPGPYVWTLAAGALPEGTHKLGHSWDTPDGQRKMPASVYSVTVDNPGTPPPPPPMPAPPPPGSLGSALPSLPPAPADIALRTISVDTGAELKSSLSDLRSGDRVIVEPGTYSTQYTIKSKRLAGPAQIIFRPGARLVGGSRSSGSYVGFYISDSDNIWVRGGDFSMPEGDAIKIDSSQNIVFHGAVAHDSGDSCFLVVTNTRDNRAIWFLDVETYSCGNDKGNLATSGSYPDGYWRRGTHGIYYGSTRNGYYTYGGAIVNYYGHDQSTGSHIQVGDGTRGLIVTGATAVRAHGDPAVYAGNALNFWGYSNQNVLWVNSIVYDARRYALNVPSGTDGSGSVLRNVMYDRIGASSPFTTSSSGVPVIGQTWRADPLLGAGDIPSANSPARGKADPAYLWRTDRVGRARTALTLGAHEPTP